MVVEVQGQLRIGRSDLGVNARRNERFMLELSRAVQVGGLWGTQCPLGCVHDIPFCGRF